MAVSISIINLIKDVTGDTREEQAVEQLRSSLENELSGFPNASGNVVLLTNVTFGGGSVGELDIVLLCDLNNIFFELNDPVDHATKTIIPQRLCYVIEVKDHDHNSVAILDNGFNVKYDGVWHPVSSQSRKQRFDFRKYLNKYLGYSPFIYNFIWFREISGSELESIVVRAKDGVAYDDNALPKSFSLKKLLQKTLYVTPDSVSWNKERTEGWMNCSLGTDMINDIVKHFTQRRIIIGKLTQERLNLLAMKDAAKEIENLEEGKLTLFEGRAGTGKTIKLLQVAIQLKKKGKRCLLLTYNHALISDINRTLFLSGIYSKPDAPTVQTSTMHSFFLELFCLFGIRNEKTIGDPEEYFNEGGYLADLHELHEFITGCLSHSEVSSLKGSCDVIDWDYLLIDEAQDWLGEEKEIVFMIYSPERIVVADGLDQFMRSDNKIDWNPGVNGKVINHYSDICLRQKPKLVRFVNGFAKELGLDWFVNENGQYNGGRVIVVDQYSTTIHAEILNDGRAAKAEPYDVLFLVPPQDVKNNQFVKYNRFKENGVYLFDGTNSNNREYFTLDNSECRLYQYESCRGLEGWTVICYDFDLLIKHKQEHFYNKILSGEIKPYLGASAKSTAIAMTYLWSLMPLTRAIDTLVITLRDPNGEIGQLLRNMHNDKRHYDGIIEWRI